MIEINLIQQKRTMGLPTVLGVDLNELPFRAIIVSLLIWYVAPGQINDVITGTLEEPKQREKKLNDQLETLQREAAKNEQLQKTIDDLLQQDKRLKERRELVKQIISLRKNPFQILLYVAKNTPDDLWIDTLELNNNALIIKGESMSYKSIGLFIENLKNAVFFDKNLRLVNSQTIKNEETGKRTEQFELSGTITRYN